MRRGHTWHSETLSQNLLGRLGGRFGRLFGRLAASERSSGFCLRVVRGCLGSLSYRTDKDLDRAGLPGHFFHGLLDRVGGLLDSLLGLSDHLVGLSFIAKLVVAGQCACGFLDSASYFVCLATHDGDSFFDFEII